MSTPPKRNPAAPRNPLHGVITDRVVKELQLRNAERCKQAIAEMGTAHVLHPHAKPRSPY